MKLEVTEIDADALALVLDSNTPITLSPEQIALLRSLLDQFAADQITMLTMQRRLERYEDSAERMDRTLAAGLNLLASRLDRPAVDRGFDFAGAKQIREHLAEQIARSSRPEEIWAAAARAALQLIRLL